jgi:CubicO group peptidase (beta-lactamase class C family)
MTLPDHVPGNSRMMVGVPAADSLRVTLANWQAPPWNRWSFQHLREILPTALVRADRANAKPLPCDHAIDIGAIELHQRESATSTVGQALAGSFADAVAVLRDGVLVYERYFDGMHQDSLHLSMSVVKSITGLLIGTMTTRGLIDPARLVTDYLPELQSSGFAGATLHHLLNMTAGTSYCDDGPESELVQLDIASGWRPPVADRAALGILDFAKSVGSGESPHGALFRYASLNTDLVAVAAERAAQARFADLLSELIWKPLGAESDAEIAVDPAGSAIASGGLSATLRDYARVGDMVLQNGVVNGRTVVPESWLALPPEATRVPAATATGTPADYWNGWWYIDGRRCGLGIHGQVLAIDRRARLVIVILSSWPAPEGAAERHDQRTVIDAIASAWNN